MQKLNIDPEFQSKIPPLTEEEFKQLEENIVSDGIIYEPIIIWNDIIVDGHNRYKIAQNHPEISFTTRAMDFPNKHAAFDWMYKNQLGRRNLTEQQRRYLIGKMYEAKKNSHGGLYNQERSKDGKFTTSGQNDAKGRTREHIAEELGIGTKTVEKAYKFSKGIDSIKAINEDAATKILTGKARVTNTSVQDFPAMDEETKNQVVKDILNGTVGESSATRTFCPNKKEGSQNDYINKAISRLYSNTTPEYGMDELLSDIATNCESFFTSMKRLLETNESIITGHEEWKAIYNCFNTSLIAKLNEIMRGK